MPSTSGNQNFQGNVSINLPCQYAYLRIARQSVMDFCSRAGLSAGKSAQLEMAVDEACSNIIEHSYGGEVDLNTTPGSHPGLQMSLSQMEDRVVVEVRDYGKGFDYDEGGVVGPKDYLQQARRRGLGMYIIRNFVDEMTYERNPKTGNCLRLAKCF